MSLRGKLTVVVIVWIVITLLAVPAGATALLYLDPLAWEAATSGSTVIDFEGLASPGTPGDYSGPGGLTLGGVQFVALTPPDSYYLYAQDPGTATKYSWGSGDLLEGPSSAWGAGYIEASLPAGYNAVGAYVMTHTNYASQVVVSIPATGESFTVDTFNQPTRAFVGLTSDVPIGAVQFRATNGYVMLDDFSYGQETPEAETLLLGGTGLLGLWIARRMRRWNC